MAFLTEQAVIDRVIGHLRLTFVAEKPPPARIFEQVVMMAAGSTHRGAWGEGEWPGLIGTRFRMIRRIIRPPAADPAQSQEIDIGSGR